MTFQIEEEEITQELVEKYIKKFEDEQSVREEAIRTICEQYRDATEECKILTKVILINQIYSTRLNNNLPAVNSEENGKGPITIDVYTLSHKLASISSRLIEYFSDDSAPCEAVELINSILPPDKYKRVTSFASKYCSWHNPEKYPIYDNISKEFLYRYLKKYKSGVTWNKLECYESFCKYYNVLKGEEFARKRTTKELDQFIWQYGKSKEQEQVVKPFETK